MSRYVLNQYSPSVQPVGIASAFNIESLRQSRGVPVNRRKGIGTLLTPVDRRRASSRALQTASESKPSLCAATSSIETECGIVSQHGKPEVNPTIGLIESTATNSPEFNAVSRSIDTMHAYGGAYLSGQYWDEGCYTGSYSSEMC